MKKTYIAPTADVISLKFSAPLICVSYTTTEADEDAEVLGRGGEYWDDEEY